MLHYQLIEHSKDSEWIVFIHGAGGSIKTWNYQVPVFKKEYNLLLIDLRDHGQSKNKEPEYSDYNFSIISEDIKEVIDHLGITKAHFITLSFGSVLIQDFSMRYPAIIHKIIIAGGIFKGTVIIRLFVISARLLNLLFSYSTMYKLFSYLLMPRKRNQRARKIYQLQSQKLSQKEYMKWIGLYREFFNLLSRFYYQQLKAPPTLVVMGTDDYVFLKSAKQFVSKQFNSQIYLLEKVGHICNIESPDLFNELTLKFLRRKNEEQK